MPRTPKNFNIAEELDKPATYQGCVVGIYIHGNLEKYAVPAEIKSSHEAYDYVSDILFHERGLDNLEYYNFEVLEIFTTT